MKEEEKIIKNTINMIVHFLLMLVKQVNVKN